MATTWITALWFLPFVLPITIWVAWSDMATMKIPNKAVPALLVVFAVVGLVALPFNEYLWRWTHFGIVLVIGFILTSIGVLGAGDSKYASAIAPFIARPDLMAYFWILAGAIAAALILHRLARGSRVRAMFPDWESWERKRDFPMGLALAPSLFFYLLVALYAGLSSS